MATITPNFNFNGQCAEAIELYCRAFGARIGCMLRNSEVQPMDDSSAIASSDLIYHAEIFIGSQRIMMCDSPDVPFMPSLSLSLTVTMDTRKEVLQAYDVLKDGCTLIYDVQSTPYSSCFVSLVDKFGFRWVIMTEQTER